MRRIRYIVVHHTAGNPKARLWDLVKRGSVWPPYDFLVREDGTVEKGRPLWVWGAHVRPDRPGWEHVNNRTSIGVALAGNFEDSPPPEAQFEAAASLVGQLAYKYKVPLKSIDDLSLRRDGGIVPHRQVTRTKCPGLFFAAMWRVFFGKVKYYYNLESKKAFAAGSGGIET